MSLYNINCWRFNDVKQIEEYDKQYLCLKTIKRRHCDIVGLFPTFRQEIGKVQKEKLLFSTKPIKEMFALAPPSKIRT